MAEITPVPGATAPQGSESNIIDNLQESLETAARTSSKMTALNSEYNVLRSADQAIEAAYRKL